MKSFDFEFLIPLVIPTLIDCIDALCSPADPRAVAVSTASMFLLRLG